jgi:hypothetical protein
MANKILKDYQGQTVRINGVCYNFIGETTTLECVVEESTSSSSESINNESSSTSSFNYSESTSESSQGYTTSSSDSSESEGNVSSSDSSNSTQSSSSESFDNVSSSSESLANVSSSQSDGCVSAEILTIIVGLPEVGGSAYSFNMIFAPGPPLYNFAEGQVCVNGIDIGSLDTSGSSNSIIVQRPTGAPVGYSIGEVVEVCEGECCYLGNYTKRCEYALNESTGIWELTGFSDSRNNSCHLDFKCSAGTNTVTQIN